MNKELFVSSTPHETKVGLVEDDLLAEIYMERENEYTLAGSIYKGRVTRVLPGMQSAFVDIGLERDAFLYVSDFMELEEHDDDLTDVIPANRGVQDLRPQAARAEAAPGVGEAVEIADTAETDLQPEASHEFSETESVDEPQPAVSAEGTPQAAGAGEQGRDRGGFRGRRRRRGGRRDGRGDGRGDGRDRGSDRDRGPDRNLDRNQDRGSETRFARPAAESMPARPQESSRAQMGPPPGYTPILLPGESISKYQRYAQQAPAPQSPAPETMTEVEPEPPNQPVAPLAATFPEDEPIFAAEAAAEPLHEEHENMRAVPEEPAESASTSTDWNQEFRRAEELSVPVLGWPGEASAPVELEEVREEEEDVEEAHDRAFATPESPDQAVPSPREEQTPVFAAPGTMEEETIDEDEADTIHYEASSDEGYDEFEEETQAGHGHLNGDARETVAEIHMSSLTESGDAHPAEAAPAEGEEDSEEFELEEAQAEAEAMLDAEARGNGTVDARVEVRAPTATAGYTQRTQRPRPGYDRDRQGGPRDRGRRGGGIDVEEEVKNPQGQIETKVVKLERAAYLKKYVIKTWGR